MSEQVGRQPAQLFSLSEHPPGPLPSATHLLEAILRLILILVRLG